MMAVYAIFVIVNMLFVAKYGLRLIGVWAWLLAAIYGSTLFFWLRLLPRLTAKKAGRCAIWIAFSVMMLAAVVMQYSIDPLTLQVDRWDGLHCPISYLLQGKYPYMAQNHLGGYASPFPIWMLLHVPFYLLGNVGLSVFAAIALLLFSIYRRQGQDAAAGAAMMLFSAAGIWYEIAVRSDLITNMLVCTAVINLLHPYLRREWLERYWLWIGIGIGLMASSRLVVLIPIAICLFPYYLKTGWKVQLGFPLVAVAIFVLTFAPFVLWDPNNFFGFEYTPWRLQTRRGYTGDMLLYLPLGVFLAMQWKGNIRRMYSNCALIIIAFWIISVAHRMIDCQVWNLFSYYYDITYFSTALPFCILAFIQTPSKELD